MFTIGQIITLAIVEAMLFAVPHVVSHFGNKKEETPVDGLLNKG
jgi:hypothetical protein